MGNSYRHNIRDSWAQQGALLLWVLELMCLLQALPQWSQQALQQHMGDAREVKTLEQLENGGTGDDIWDAMQHQLKTYGIAPFPPMDHPSCCQSERESELPGRIC